MYRITFFRNPIISEFFSKINIQSQKKNKYLNNYYIVDYDFIENKIAKKVWNFMKRSPV